MIRVAGVKCKSSGLPRLVLNLYILDSVVVVVVHTQPELDKHQITNAYLRIVSLYCIVHLAPILHTIIL